MFYLNYIFPFPIYFSYRPAYMNLSNLTNLDIVHVHHV